MYHLLRQCRFDIVHFVRSPRINSRYFALAYPGQLKHPLLLFAPCYPEMYGLLSDFKVPSLHCYPSPVVAARLSSAFEQCPFGLERGVLQQLNLGSSSKLGGCDFIFPSPKERWVEKLGNRGKHKPVPFSSPYIGSEVESTAMFFILKTPLWNKLPYHVLCLKMTSPSVLRPL